MSLTMFDIYYISHDISYDISCRILCIEYKIYIYLQRIYKVFTTYLQRIYKVFSICEYVAHKFCKNVEISNVEL